MTTSIILDRDGVINQDSPHYIKSADEWLPIPGSLEAIALLTNAGYHVYVATNQAGIARGKLSLQSLQHIHEKMYATVEKAGGKISDLRFCPHHPDDDCECRKPKPGLLLQLANAHQLTLAQSYFVGDSLKDLLAAEAAGCTGVLVLTGNGKETHQKQPTHEPVFADLLAFAHSMVA